MMRPETIRRITDRIIMVFKAEQVVALANIIREEEEKEVLEGYEKHFIPDKQ